MENLVDAIKTAVAAGEIDSAELKLPAGVTLVLKRDQPPPSFTCPTCGKKAVSRRGLTKHINSKHSNGSNA